MNAATLVLIKSALKLDESIRPLQKVEILRFLSSVAARKPVQPPMGPSEITEKYLTPKEAAIYLGLSKRTLSRYVRAGKVKPSRLNSRVLRFRKPDLDAFIAGSDQ